MAALWALTPSFIEMRLGDKGRNFSDYVAVIVSAAEWPFLFLNQVFEAWRLGGLDLTKEIEWELAKTDLNNE